MEISALIVDDSGIMRKMVMRALRETDLANFVFTEAQDGVDALEKFDPEKINMIFVDWNMPNMNGIDFVKKVRSEQKRHIPVVMVTTESTVGKVEEALNEARVDCFIVKPFTPEVLEKKLEPLFTKIAAAAKKKSDGFFGKIAKSLS
ncbi:MAG: response regulator [Phycisphaerae bacterium]